MGARDRPSRSGDGDSGTWRYRRGYGRRKCHLDAIPMILIGGRSPLLDDELLPLPGGIDRLA